MGKANSNPSNDAHPKIQKSCASLNVNTRKSPTLLPKTRRTCKNYKTCPTNSKLRLDHSRNKLRMQLKMPTKLCPNSASSNTSSTKPTNVLKWPKLQSTKHATRLVNHLNL